MLKQKIIKPENLPEFQQKKNEKSCVARSYVIIIWQEEKTQAITIF